MAGRGWLASTFGACPAGDEAAGSAGCAWPTGAAIAATRTERRARARSCRRARRAPFSSFTGAVIGYLRKRVRVRVAGLYRTAIDTRRRAQSRSQPLTA